MRLDSTHRKFSSVWIGPLALAVILGAMIAIVSITTAKIERALDPGDVIAEGVLEDQIQHNGKTVVLFEDGHALVIDEVPAEGLEIGRKYKITEKAGKRTIAPDEKRRVP